MYCPNCGAANSADNTVCTTCGKSTAVATVAASVAPPPPAPTSTDGKAIASLILGIVWIAGLGSLLAIILGHLSRKQIRESKGRLSGSGMALAGLVLGYIGICSIAAVFTAGLVIASLPGTRGAVGSVVAVARLHTLNAALIRYAVDYPQIGYPKSLDALASRHDGANAGPDAAGLLNGNDAGPANLPVAGYRLEYTPGPGSPSTGYTLRASPQPRYGSRYFFTSQDGVIRYRDGSPADATSPEWQGPGNNH